MGFSPPKGYGLWVIADLWVRFSTHRLGGLKKVWDMRVYGLSQAWVMRGSTVFPF